MRSIIVAIYELGAKEIMVVAHSHCGACHMSYDHFHHEMIARGVTDETLDKVGKIADRYPSLCSFYTDVTEEPLLVGHFLVYSGPTVLLFMNGKEVYRGANFINLEELERTINQYLSLEETI